VAAELMARLCWLAAAIASTWMRSACGSRAPGRTSLPGLRGWASRRGSSHAAVYLWRRLPDGLDSTAVARDCMRENVMLTPGHVFSAHSQQARPRA